MHHSQNTVSERNAARCQSLTITLFLALCQPLSADGQEASALWGDLAPGPYNIGFQTIFTRDLSRPSVPYSDWDGKLYPTSENPGRQMQINLWYPAAVAEADRRLDFGHYVDLMARQTDFGPITEEKRRFTNEQFVLKANALGGEGALTLENLELLRGMATAAYDDPAPVNGTFPLIVFPNGGSPAFQSIMSEFFASHGFVVAAGALKGRYGLSEDISAKGFETAMDDLGFLINEVLNIEQIDTERICLIANAITSSQIVAYQARNSKIDCLVSLDGGLPSQFEQGLLRQTVFYEPQEINKPILVIYAPHPSIDPQFIDHLRYSQQFRFHFPQMSEFHFLNFGAFEKFVPKIIGEPPGDVGKGFELAASYSLRFFKAFLEGDGESETFLLESPLPTIAAHIDRAEVTEALPSPPNIATVKNGFLNQGIESLQDVYWELKRDNPTPFSLSFYGELKDWLAWKKDPSFENRYQLYQLALDSYPDSTTVNFEQAYHALQTGREEIARRLNNRTLELLESDTSNELTTERKARMRELIFQDLDSLN